MPLTVMLCSIETADSETGTPTGKLIIGRLTYKSRKVGIPADQKVPTTGNFKSTRTKSLFGTEEHIIEYDFTAGSDADAAAARKALESKVQQSLSASSDFDVSKMKECVSVYFRDAEVIPAGVTLYSMSLKHKNEEYQRYASEYDIHFLFDDKLPRVDFYTVPQVDIFATDGRNGFIVSVGSTTDLESSAPICYIDGEKKCFRIAGCGKEFLENAMKWKTLLQPCQDIEIFSSEEAARIKYEFIRIDKGNSDE